MIRKNDKSPSMRQELNKLAAPPQHFPPADKYLILGHSGRATTAWPKLRCQATDRPNHHIKIEQCFL